MFTQFKPDYFFLFSMKQRPEFFFQLWVARLFILFTKTARRTRWNDFLFLITDDRNFRPQTCSNGLVFRECKHIKNIFEDVYFTKISFHITLMSLTGQSIKSNHNLFVYTSLEQFHNISDNGCRHILYKESVNCKILIITYLFFVN